MTEMQPTIREAFRITWKQHRSLFYLLIGINLLVVFTFIPFFAIVVKELTHSLYGDQLFRQLQIPWLIELFQNHRDLFVMMPTQGILFAVFILIGWWFSSGAFIGVIHEDKRAFRDFLLAGIHNFFPMFKVSIIGLIPLIVFVILASVLKAPITALIKHSLSFTPIFVLRLFRAFLLIVLFLFVRMWLDTTRAYVIVQPDLSTWKAFWSAGRILRTRSGGVIKGYYDIAVIGTVILAVYLLFSYHWPLHSMGTVLFLFILQQIYLFTRMVLRFASLAYMRGFIPALEEQPSREPAPQPSAWPVHPTPTVTDIPPPDEAPPANDLS